MEMVIVIFSSQIQLLGVLSLVIRRMKFYLAMAKATSPGQNTTGCMIVAAGSLPKRELEKYKAEGGCLDNDLFAFASYEDSKKEEP